MTVTLLRAKLHRIRVTEACLDYTGSLTVDLEFEPDALRALARDALARKTGARGLRAAMEKIMTDIMYNVAGGKSTQKVVITAAMVEEGLK